MKDLRELASFVLGLAKEAGADSAQTVAARRTTREFNVESGKFTLLRTLFDDSLSVTVFCGGRQGAVSVNRFDDETMRNAVRDAAEAAKAAAPDPAWEIDRSGRECIFEDGPAEADAEMLFARAKEYLAMSEEKFPKLLIEEMIAEHSFTHAVYANTYGTLYESKKGGYRFSSGYSAHEGEKSSHSFGSGALLTDLSVPFMECAMTEREMADTEKQASPVPFEGKMTGTVLFTPGCLADVVFGTILGSFVSDMPLIDGTSTWKDKLGTQVADPRITLRLAPHDPKIRLGADYTGEGFLTEDFDVIKDGVLQSFVLSQYGANKTGGVRSGNASGAMVCPAGDKPLADIIAGIENGIMIGRFSGGQPGANGEFSGIAKNSFLIRDGKIVCALSEAMISANLNEMLFKLRDVSCETADDGTSSIPYMAFDGVTISGK